MVSRSTILPILFAVPTCLYSQTVCGGLTFSGTRQASLSNNGAGFTQTGLIRQPDGSFDAVDVQLGTLQLGNVYSNYQSVILAGCGSGTSTQTLPNLPNVPPVPGVGSQTFAIADFKNSGTPSAVFAPSSSTPQISFGSVFSPNQVVLATYVASSAVAGLVAGDFNNDGNYDFVAVVNGTAQIPGGVQIFLGNGAGAFKNVASYGAGSNAAGVTVADLNQDGKLDLVVCGYGNGAITVLLGNGDGTFQATAATPMAGQNPLAVIAADFNHDHKLDLAVANLDGTVSIFLGNGDGSFQTAANFKAGAYSTFLAAGDFTGDGNLDLAVNVDQNRVSILMGKGDGTFGAPTFYSGGSFGLLALVLTDFNNDGNLDILVGTGTPDYIGPSQGYVGVMFGNGDGTFQGTQMLSTGKRSLGLAITDLNADGNPDVVVANENSGNLSVFLGQGNGKFQALPSSSNTSGFGSPASVAAADFNGDGKMDLATAVQSAPGVAISLGNGDGTFQAPNVLAAGATPVVVAVGDLNGDGKPDLVVADNGSQDPASADEGAVLVFLSNGSTFQAVKRFAAGSHPSSVVIADVNLDGKPDLVVSDGGQPGETSTGGVSVLLGDGLGNFGAAVSYTNGTLEGISVAAADVNGDGKPDLVVPALDNNFNNEVLIFLGAGDGTFLPPGTLVASQTNASVIAGDFNGDGKLDLVLANCCGETTMSYYLGNGDGTFQPEGDFNGDSDPEFVAAADFNNDGKPDLAIANAPVSSGGLTILMNLTPAAPTNMTANSNSTPQSAAAGSAFAKPLAVTLTDRSGKPVAGVSVTFTAPSSGASGTFQGGGASFNAITSSSGIATAAAFTANASAGTYSVTATAAGLPAVSFTLTNTALPPVNMTANSNTTPQSAASGIAFANALAVTVTDGSGHPVGGVSVTFTAPLGGASGTFQGGGNTFPTLTNSSGIATAAAFTANASAGTYSVTATAAGLPAVSFTLTNTALPPVNMTANSNTTPQSAASGIAFANALAVTVTDGSGHPVGGVSVAFTAPSGGASGTFQGGGNTFPTLTNSSGIATAPAFTANANAGTYTVTATSAGLPTVSFALTNTSTTHPAFFAGEDFLSGSAYYLQFPDGDLFGYYEYLSSTIFYHFDMGFEAFVPSTGSQIYFYDFGSGHWWYTTASLFPYIYDFTLNTFIYYFPNTTSSGHYTTNPRYFSNLTTNMIFTM